MEDIATQNMTILGTGKIEKGRIVEIFGAVRGEAYGDNATYMESQELIIAKAMDNMTDRASRMGANAVIQCTKPEYSRETYVKIEDYRHGERQPDQVVKLSTVAHRKDIFLNQTFDRTTYTVSGIAVRLEPTEPA